jgi:hypothetical protein
LSNFVELNSFTLLKVVLKTQYQKIDLFTMSIFSFMENRCQSSLIIDVSSKIIV